MKINYWLRMAGGDRNAFLTIYQNHYRALFCYSFSITTDKQLTKDCIQELFPEIWKTRNTLNTDVSNVRSYMFTWFRRKISYALSRPQVFLPRIAFNYSFAKSQHLTLKTAGDQKGVHAAICSIDLSIDGNQLQVTHSEKFSL